MHITYNTNFHIYMYYFTINTEYSIQHTYNQDFRCSHHCTKSRENVSFGKERHNQNETAKGTFLLEYTQANLHVTKYLILL